MNMVKTVLICLVYALLNVSGAALIKLEIPHHNLSSLTGFVRLFTTWRVILGFFIVSASAVVLIKALSMERFSYIIPISIGINFSLTMILGLFLFNDRFTIYSYIGLALIFFGIVLMSLKTA